MSEKIGAFVLKILFWVVATVILAAGVMVIWNLYIPDLFGLSKLNYGQAFGVTLLANLLTTNNPIDLDE